MEGTNGDSDDNDANVQIRAVKYNHPLFTSRISVEHITRDINNEWLIRYMHANGASFCIVVFIHIF